MRTTLKVLAVTSAVLAAGASSPAMATYHCAAGYKYYNHACHPMRSSGHGNSASAPARSLGWRPGVREALQAPVPWVGLSVERSAPRAVQPPAPPICF